MASAPGKHLARTARARSERPDACPGQRAQLPPRRTTGLQVEVGLRQATAYSDSHAFPVSRVTFEVEGVDVRRSRSVTRAIVGSLAGFAGFALLACGVAAASITLFEPTLFRVGSVNGQTGVGGAAWKSSPVGAINCVNTNPPPATIPGQYDQEVVRNGLEESVGFGVQSLRMSNACASGEFFYQTYSPREPLQVGEARLNKVFLAEFAFMSATPAHQPGLFLSVSPDSGEGSRMSWVGLQDTPDGIQVSVTDTPDVDGEFVAHPGPLLAHSRPHTIRFWIKVNPGIDNDLVRISVDGVDLGQCFTTWENYYRTAPEQAPPPNVNTPADINSLQFRSSVPGPAGLAASGGYLFDNVSITPSNGPGPPGCRDGGEVPPPDIDIDKETQTQFALPGQLITYRLSVRNRGDAPVRSLRACDRVPRALRFVAVQCASASRRGPAALPHDPSAAARSAQDVPGHLPAARERHGELGRQRGERGHPNRVRAVTVPGRHRSPPRAAATPGRQGRRDDRRPPIRSLRGGSEPSRPPSLPTMRPRRRAAVRSPADCASRQRPGSAACRPPTAPRAPRVTRRPRRPRRPGRRAPGTRFGHCTPRVARARSSWASGRGLLTPAGFRSQRTSGRTVKLDLRGKAEGNYNVRLISRYRTRSGRVQRITTWGHFSVACA